MATAFAHRRKLGDITKKLKAAGLTPRTLTATPSEVWSGHAIRGVRRRLGATQEEFARILGVATSSVHRWEAGRVAPDRRACGKLAGLREILRILDKHFRVEGRVLFFKTPQARLEGDRPMDLLGLPSAGKRIGDLIKSMLAGDFS